MCEAPATRGDRCAQCGIAFAHPSYVAMQQADAAIRQCDDRWRELWAVREQWVQHRRISLEHARAAVEARPAPPVHAAAGSGASAPRPAAGEDTASAGAAPGFTRAAASGDAAAAPAPATTVDAVHVPAGATAGAAAARRSRLTAPVMLGVGGAALLIASAIVFIAVTWTTLEPALQALMVGALAAGVGVLAVWLDRRSLSVSAGAVGVVSMAFASVAVVALDRDFAVLGGWGGAVVLAVASTVGRVLHRLRVDWTGMTAALAAALAAFWGAVGSAAEIGPWGGTELLTFVVAAAVLSGAVAALSWVWSPPAGATVLRWSAVALASAAGLAALAAPFDGAEPVAVALAGAAPVAVLTALALRWTRLALAPLPALVPAWWAAVALAGSDEDPAAALLAGAGAWAVLMLVATRSGATRQRVTLAASVPVGAWFALTALVVLGDAAAWTLSAATSAGVQAQMGDWIAQPAVLGVLGLAIAASATVLVRWWRVAAAWSVPAQVTGAWLAVAAAASAPALAGSSPTVIALAVVGGGAVLAAACRVWSAPAARWTAGLGGLSLGLVAGMLSAWQGAVVDPWALAVGAVAVAAVAAGIRWQPRVASAPAIVLASVVAGAAGWALSGTRTGVIGVAAGVAVAALAALRWTRPAWALVAAAGAIPALATAAVVVVVSVASSVIALLSGGTDGGASWWTFVAAGLVGAGATLARDLPGLEDGDREPLDGITAGAALAVPPVVLGAMVATLPATTGREAAAQSLSATTAVALAVAASMLPRGLLSRTVRVGSMAWLSVLTVVAAGRLADLESSLMPGALVLLALVVVQIAMAVRWPRLAAASAALAVTVAAAAVPAAAGWSTIEAVACGATAVAVAAWVATRLPAPVRTRVLLGAAPIAVVAGFWFVGAALGSFAAAYDQAFADVPRALPEWSYAVLAGAVVAAAAAFRWIRRHALAEITGVGAFVASQALALPATWIVPAALGAALVVAGMLRFRLRRLRGAGVAVMLAAIPWAAVDEWSAGLTAVLAGLALTWVSAATPRRWPLAELSGAAVLGALGAGLLLATAASVEAALIGALVVGSAAALAPWMARRDRTAVARVSLLAALTVGCAAWSPTQWGAGLVLLIAAAAWWALRMQGWRPAWWVSAGAASLGIAMLLSSANATVVELYVAAPAAIALVVGVRALRRDAQMPSVRALAPGLAIVLVPSLIALALEPASLGRTLGLTAGVLALAICGAALKWLAPIGAAAIAAVAVSLTQASASDAVLSRWIAFALVGGVLIALAATFEKIRGMR
ncbi:hypothetical protein Dac01nite_02180 [Demequina activiva]|uniref:Uncharacterized protein n=1 Tax=Demequina activiva TaxID=1582364 RepID=A0A919Q221_9MICO|nr:hypothetical protein Dac01nite_02180 [Demequina activiva]